MNKFLLIPSDFPRRKGFYSYAPAPPGALPPDTPLFYSVQLLTSDGPLSYVQVRTLTRVQLRSATQSACVILHWAAEFRLVGTFDGQHTYSVRNTHFGASPTELFDQRTLGGTPAANWTPYLFQGSTGTMQYGLAYVQVDSLHPSIEMTWEPPTDTGSPYRDPDVRYDVTMRWATECVV